MTRTSPSSRRFMPCVCGSSIATAPTPVWRSKRRMFAFGAQAPGLSDTPLAAKVDARHLDWSQQLPAEPQDLWDALTTFDVEARQRLFAHCVSLTVNAVHEPWSRRPRAIAHADRLAVSLSLDIAATGWTPTVDNFLGRVTKARIVQAVREAKGADAARRIEGLKKGDMAQEAEQLLAGTNWLPEPLRTPGHAAECFGASIFRCRRSGRRRGRRRIGGDRKRNGHRRNRARGRC